jgi:DUF971 family protein
MAGLSANTPIPTQITAHQQSGQLEVAFSDGKCFKLPFELMRVYSPSAEVQGHSPDQAVLQTGKRGVGLQSIEPVGHYAIKPVFTDGHASGIFSWDYLYFLGEQHDALWTRYLDALERAELDRDTPMPSASSRPHGSGCE